MDAPERQPTELFDRNARRIRRHNTRDDAYFVQHMTTDLIERLDLVARRFSKALVIGDRAPLCQALGARMIDFDVYRGDEDQLVGHDATYDLILSSGTLDTVTDLPGALLLMRRALKPDGLMLANFAAAPTLTALKTAIIAADGDRAVARLHPQIDVRSAGDLLMRAGFALPVADLDTLDIAYVDLMQLVRDLRESGANNALTTRYPVTRRWYAAACAAFARLADEQQRTHETLSFVTLTGWAPAPDQPQPARRGSATASLADALRRKND